jgi:hypothetical protein
MKNTDESAFIMSMLCVAVGLIVGAEHPVFQWLYVVGAAFWIAVGLRRMWRDL